MIPVLHPADSSSWTTFGIGALTDAKSCTVTEERNGLYELEMTYPITGQHYKALALRMIILAKPNYTDDPQPFRIYKISRPLNGIVTVNAQHLCYDLSGYISGTFSAVGVQSALAALTANCTPYPCPFTFSSDMSSATGTMKVSKPTSLRALMGGTSGSVLTYWHGEWSYDKYSCVLNANRGADRGVTIRYGKNLTAIKQEENNAAVYTGIYPFYHNKDTDALVTLQEKTITVPGTFSYTKICPVDLSDKFEAPPSESELRNEANKYIADHDIGVPDVNLQLNFVQMDELSERVDLCDTVHVYFDALNVTASAKCVKAMWDVLADRYSKIELGSIRASIADTIAGIKSTSDQAYEATSTLVDTARTVSEKITGQLGGYVVMNDTDNDGEPDEILIMDTANKETATNIIRMNNGGIAFSQNGYHGTYGTAWSIDGQFVADYITSGVLQANLIRILGTTNFYWDAGNIYIINPQDSGQQIRIGQYDGTRYGIGFTRDGGLTWQTAMDFQGLNVSATGFSKTYVSLTPPDPSDYGLESFNIGDIWVESDRRYSWNEVVENTWNIVKKKTWSYWGGDTDPNMYTWNGGSWQKVYDGESFTSFDARLTVAEEEIAIAVASVASKGTTYVQLTDPVNDPSITINTGDHWIKADPGYSVVPWLKAETYSWQQLARTYNWNSMEGPTEYAWDGYSWVVVSDHGAEVRHATALVETDKEIIAMAQAQTTMNGQLVENTAQLSIQANQIQTEVTQRKAGQTELSSRITQNAQSIETEVSRATGAEGTLSTRITQTANAITSEVTRATGAEGSLSTRITQNANSITSEVNRATGAESALGTLITQTADDIMVAVGEDLDNKYTIQTGIDIKRTGITIAAGKKLQVAAEDIQFVSAQTTLSAMLEEIDEAAAAAQSDVDKVTDGTTAVPYVKTTGITIKNGSIAMTAGGSFTVDSGNFNIDASGNVTMKGTITASSGYIGSGSNGFTINNTAIYNRKSGIGLPSAQQTLGVYLGVDGIALGTVNIGTTQSVNLVDAFSVDRNGNMTARSAVIRGDITVDAIHFSSGVTLDGSNITAGTITEGKIGSGAITEVKLGSGAVTTAKIGSGAVTGVKIGSGAVSKTKTDSDVQTSLNNGDSAVASFRSLTSGSVTASYLKATNIDASTLRALSGFSVKDGNINRAASWRSMTVVTNPDTGTTRTIYYLGRV